MRQQDLEAIRGDTEEWELTVLEREDGPAKDLTGAEALEFCVKWPRERTVIEKSLGDGVTITDAPAGKAHIVVSPADTDALPNRRIRFMYEVELRDSAGKVHTPVGGIFTLKPAIAL